MPKKSSTGNFKWGRGEIATFESKIKIWMEKKEFFSFQYIGISGSWNGNSFISLLRSAKRQKINKKEAENYREI